jgi:hypothetical protein
MFPAWPQLAAPVARGGPPHRRRRAWLAAAALVGGLGVLVLAVRFGPALALAAALAVPAVGEWHLAAGRETVRDEVLIATERSPVRADLYRPAHPRVGLLLVHGLSPAGGRHPELVRLARLLARHGVLVLVPHVEGLAALRLSGREVDEVRAALQHLRRLHDRVGVAGFSFGAGPALLAAADVPGVRLAASFGGYADLTNVVRFVTTGTHGVGDRRYRQPQEEYNRWKLLALLAGFAETGRDRARLAAVARRKLDDPAADTAALEARLGRSGRALVDLVRSRDPDAVGARLAALPARARRTLAALSPLPAAARLAGRLLVAHGVADPSTPFTESLRLAAASGDARLALFRTFDHTGPLASWSSLRAHLRDAWTLVRVADSLLRME